MMERFKDAFVKELQVFTDCVLDDKRTYLIQPRSSNFLTANESKALPVNLADALQASIICHALTLSFRSGKPVYFDDNGDIIPPA